MSARLRKWRVISEGTAIRATLTDPKLVHGQYGRQAEVTVNVTRGGEDNQYRGTTFPTWFSFGKDKETGEEFISYGGPLYQLLSLKAPNIDEVLSEEDLSDREYEKWLKMTVKALDETDIYARVGVKATQQNEAKRRNFLQPGAFGLYRDTEEEFEDIDLGGERAENTPRLF